MNTTTSITQFAWLSNWSIWIWFLLVSIALVAPMWLYRNTQVPPTQRRILTLLRTGTFVWVVIVLANPATQTTINRKSHDQIIFLVDNSASMLVEDVVVDSTTISRHEQLKSILNDNQDTLDSIQSERVSYWYGYHGYPFKIDPDNLGESTGRRTDLLTTIKQTIDSTENQPTTAIVIFGDGRENHQPPPGLLNQVQTQNIPLITIPLGSNQPLDDVDVTSVTTPHTSYTGDLIPVFVDLSFQGDVENLGDIHVVLVDVRSGTTLDTKQLDTTEMQSRGNTKVILQGVSEEQTEGTITWRVDATTQNPEANQKNNSKEIDIQTTNKPLRVLYVEGGPRWEYRYLKNLLVRDQSITSSTLLLTADSEFVQEGDRPINRLPSTEEEMLGWDVIIIGDIPPTTWTTQQADTIKSLVDRGDISLVWLGGENWGPNKWTQSPLVDLLPIQLPTNIAAFTGPFHCVPTDTGVDRAILERYTGNDDDPMYWSQQIAHEKLKPGVEVLANSHPLNNNSTNLPILMSMRYGSGVALYSATDEYWRWRNRSGEHTYKQFWVQLLRSTQTHKPSPDQDRIRLTINPNQATVGIPIDVEIECDNSQNPKAFIRSPGDQEVVYIQLEQSKEDESKHTSTWVATKAGNYTLGVTSEDPLTTDIYSEEFGIKVVDDSNEARQSTTNHNYLAELSNATGGAHILPKDLNTIRTLIPDRSTLTTTLQNKSLWGHPWLYFPPIFFLTLEWLLRRKYNLA